MFGGWDLLAFLCLSENTHKAGADVRYMGALLGLQKNYVKQPIECPENKLQGRGRAEMQRILSSVQKLPEEKNPHIYATLV